MKIWTNSRSYRWRECKYKHHLEYVEGWRPVKTTEALRMGILFHLGLEEWWTTLMEYQQDSEALMAKHEGLTLLGVMLDRMMKSVEGRAFDTVEQIRVEEMLYGYHQKWRHAASLGEYQVNSVERTWVAPMTNPETGRASRTWSLAGKFDVIATHMKRGKTVIIEHKTCDMEIEDPTNDYWLKLRMDNQISQYYLGVQSSGTAVDGCLYDVARRPRHKPKATKIIRKKKTETDEEFAERKLVEAPMETDEEFRLRLRDVIAADTDHWFQRMFIDRTNADLEMYAWDAWEESKMAHDAQRKGRAPRNPSACLTFGQCPYWLHCSTGAPMEGNDSFQRIEFAHPELDQAVVGTSETPDDDTED